MLRLTNKHTDGGKTAAISQRNDNNSQRAARSVISLPIVTEKSAILIILSYLPKPQPFLSAGPVAGASRVMGGTIWKSKILMANADLSRSCCSNQPAFSFTQLLVSREGGGVWLVRVRVHGWGGLWGSMCAKARLMLCVEAEYKWRICQTAIFGSR